MELSWGNRPLLPIQPFDLNKSQPWGYSGPPLAGYSRPENPLGPPERPVTRAPKRGRGGGGIPRPVSGPATVLGMGRGIQIEFNLNLLANMALKSVAHWSHSGWQISDYKWLLRRKHCKNELLSCLLSRYETSNDRLRIFAHRLKTTQLPWSFLLIHGHSGDDKPINSEKFDENICLPKSQYQLISSILLLLRSIFVTWALRSPDRVRWAGTWSGLSASAFLKAASASGTWPRILRASPRRFDKEAGLA